MFEIPKNLNSEHFKYSEKYIFYKNVLLIHVNMCFIKRL